MFLNGCYSSQCLTGTFWFVTNKFDYTSPVYLLKEVNESLIRKYGKSVWIRSLITCWSKSKCWWIFFLISWRYCSGWALASLRLPLQYFLFCNIFQPKQFFGSVSISSVVFHVFSNMQQLLTQLFLSPWPTQANRRKLTNLAVFVSE